MSSNSAPQHKLRIVFRWIAISLTAIVATWLAVILWWQTTQRAVSSGDAILYLAVLPLVILLAIGVLRWRLSAKADRPPAPADSPNAASGSVSDEAVSRKTTNTSVLGAWAITSLAPDAEATIENLLERRSRPTPDEYLTDSHGFPLLTGRVKDLDTGSITAILMHMRMEDPSVPEDMRDTLLRALALLDSVLQQAAYEWPLPVVDPDQLRSREDNTRTLRGVGSVTAAETPLLDLRVTLLLSEELTRQERQLAQEYVAERLIMLGVTARRLQVNTITAADDAAALRLADEFATGVAGQSGDTIPAALLLLACDSALCPTIAEQWDAQGRLFDSRRPQGVMPGEAAFGILLANEKALQEAASSSLCHLSRIICTCRADGTATNNSSACLAGAIGAALSAANVSGDDVGMVVCDADHRTSRTLESIEAVLDQMPRLDAIQNRLAISEACGHLGAASALGVLALGAMQSRHAGHPVLVFNVSHASERAAAVVRPAEDERNHARAQHLEAA